MPFTNGAVDRPWVVGREFESHVHHENAFIIYGVVDRPWVVGREFESHVHYENAF